MATMKNPTSSSSSSSSFTYGLAWTYDVFISFRGVDTRLGFTGNLYKALRGKEVNTFMDDHDLEKGAEITQALDKAIQESRIALVIFSKNYASSTFCLEELAKIMECSKEKGMLVWPVFYQVEPAEVRHQKGSYAEALAKHQVWNYEKQKIEKWKLALQKAAKLSGWHFRSDGEKYEYEFIDNIIHSISKKISNLREGDKNQIICKALQRNDTADKFQQITEKIEAAALDEISYNKLDILSTENPQVDTFEGENVSIKHKPPVIPDYFRCPISLELMKDPVIVSTGQTYERSCIQKWLDVGYRTCPMTEQKLSHTALTPNHALRSLIASWCDSNGVELPKNQGNYKTKKSGSNLPYCDLASVNVLLDKLANGDTEQKRVAAGELRLLSKRNADNRVCIAEAGSIPLLVDLLSSSDPRTQEHVVTTLLNLSINESNKDTIVNAGAIPDILDILKSGSMEARENAAATIWSLSVVDENRVTIGAAGAIPPLIKLLCEGTHRGKKDAATAIFNLSNYQANKLRAVKAGIVTPLMRFLKDAGSGMVDEALAIMAILASQHEGRIAICQAEPVPILIEVIRTGSPPNRENGAAVLWSLCTGDLLQLKLAKQLGVEEALQELSENGTDRAKRKAGSILELLQRTEGGDNLQNSYSYRTSVYS